MQDICDEEQAGLFISTYNTSAEHTHSVILLHDMIPETTGQDLDHSEWRAKAAAIERASAFFAVSKSTLADFRSLYPDLADREVYLTPNAAGPEFKPAAPADVAGFRGRCQIQKPYFLLIGNRTLYKNAILFFRSFASWSRRREFEVVCAGGAAELEPCFQNFVRDVRCQVVRLTNAELAAAYSGAAALVYPSRAEGFGLPVLEAQQCRCPVITCRNTSLGEVAGDAALFVGESDVAGLRRALDQVLVPDVRRRLVEAGEQNARRYSWATTGQVLAGAIRKVRAEVAPRPLREGAPLDTIQRFAWGLGKTGTSRGLHSTDDLFRHGLLAPRAQHAVHGADRKQRRADPRQPSPRTRPGGGRCR